MGENIKTFFLNADSIRNEIIYSRDHDAKASVLPYILFIFPYYIHIYNIYYFEYI